MHELAGTHTDGYNTRTFLTTAASSEHSSFLFSPFAPALRGSIACDYLECRPHPQQLKTTPTPTHRYARAVPVHSDLAGLAHKPHPAGTGPVHPVTNNLSAKPVSRISVNACARSRKYARLPFPHFACDLSHVMRTDVALKTTDQKLRHLTELRGRI